MINILEMNRISKKYGNNIANNNITFKVKKGSIHALVGENGAGKSTLMNILYGIQKYDTGEILLNNKQIHLNSPSDAIDIGIGMVHQHFMLAPSLTVLENIILGNKNNFFLYLNKKSIILKINKIIEDYNLNIDINRRIDELSVGEMQRVEIIKLLYRNVDLLILDEPTAVLTPNESQDLFKIIKLLSKQNKTIIFISHKLKEVLQISKQITVLRNGKLSGEIETQKADEDQLTKMMIGRSIERIIKKNYQKNNQEILNIHNLNYFNNLGGHIINNLNISIQLGEIVGIAGVEGNGQTELFELISGITKNFSGDIIYNNININNFDCRKRRKLGISFIPEDRILRGVSLNDRIYENIIVNDYYKFNFSRYFILNKKFITRHSDNLIKEYNIVADNYESEMNSLSGGNMQKVVLAREIFNKPKLLIASQPTRGVDVGSIEFIHKKIIELRDTGNSILLISADLDEIYKLSDSIYVMYEGQVSKKLSIENANEHQIGMFMTGIKKSK